MILKGNKQLVVAVDAMRETAWYCVLAPASEVDFSAKFCHPLGAGASNKVKYVQFHDLSALHCFFQSYQCWCSFQAHGNQSSRLVIPASD